MVVNLSMIQTEGTILSGLNRVVEERLAMTKNTGGYCEQIEQDGGREPINDPDTKENCKPLDCDCEQEEQDDGENLSVRQTYGTNVSRYHMMMEPVNDPDTGGAWEFPGSQPRWNPPSLYRTSELAG